MKNFKKIRKVVCKGLLFLCVLSVAAPLPCRGAGKPAKPTTGKQLPSKPAAGQPLLIVRGKITLAYWANKTNQDVQGIDVILSKRHPGGRSEPFDRKKTDSDGTYAFSINPAEKGNQFEIKPWMDESAAKTYCRDRSRFQPGNKIFTLSAGRGTAGGVIEQNFELLVPLPDLSLKLEKVNVPEDQEYGGVWFHFIVRNEGCVSVQKSATITVQYENPYNAKILGGVPYPIEGGGERHVEINGPYLSDVLTGCPFTATLSQQPYEEDMTDNRVTGITPVLDLPDIAAGYDDNFVYVRNKGLKNACFYLTWKGEGVDFPLNPADGSSPVVPPTLKYQTGANACLDPGRQLKYFRPRSNQANFGWLEADPRNNVRESNENNNLVQIPLK